MPGVYSARSIVTGSIRTAVSRKAYGFASLFSLIVRSCSVFAEYTFWTAVATASESRLRLVQIAGFCMEGLYHVFLARRRLISSRHAWTSCCTNGALGGLP